MEATMEDLVYTKEDIEVLAQTATLDFGAILESIECDPDRFKELMRKSRKQFKFIYQTPFEDLMAPEIFGNPSIQGFLQWRLRIGK